MSARTCLLRGASIGAALLTALAAAQARAQSAVPGMTAPNSTVAERLDRAFDLGGYFRVRFDLLDNFDLNHGPTPSTGQPLFPTAISEGGGPLTSGNMRLRFDPSVRVGWGVQINARIDFLDNVVMGSTPDGLPASTSAPVSGSSVTMAPPTAGYNAQVDSVRVKRAWGQVLLPFGVLAAGRMGALFDWGTGFFANSGDCIDCDLGDVGDRVVLTLPMLGHLFSLAFDFGASGPTSSTLRSSDPQPFDLDRRDDVRNYALLIAHYDLPHVVDRYLRAGRTVWQYGLLSSLRTQQLDLPTYYLTGDLDRAYGPDDVVRRELLAFAGDLWIGLRRGGWSVDLEGAVVLSQTENASLLPGVQTRQAITARQFGGVGRVQYRWPRLELTLELGAASGDSAPGFGYRSAPNQLSSRPGDLDGPQIAVPTDTTIDNFRFNPDYHIDLILWRQLIGTVTDAFYSRPSARWQPLKDLWLESALIASFAMQPESTPSGERPLGVELDLGARYRLEPGFEFVLTYGLLLPLSGLDNSRLGLDAEPAQTLHAILAFRVP